MFGDSPRVVRISHMVPGAVVVDRTSPWGNPFVIGKDGNRDEVCDRFEAYATIRAAREPQWLVPLIGKDLACHCVPKRCHAQTLLRLANAIATLALDGPGQITEDASATTGEVQRHREKP